MMNKMFAIYLNAYVVPDPPPDEGKPGPPPPKT
jgi:hypothetical protein